MTRAILKYEKHSCPTDQGKHHEAQGDEGPFPGEAHVPAERPPGAQDRDDDSKAEHSPPPPGERPVGADSGLRLAHALNLLSHMLLARLEPLTVSLKPDKLDLGFEGSLTNLL